MLRKALAVVALIGVVGFILILTACGKTTSDSTNGKGRHVTASQSAVAKQLAKCLPTAPVAQIALAKSLTSTAGRTKLADSCGIPPQRRAAFEQALLADGENGHLTTHAGRVTFFEVTVPHLIEVNQ